MNCGKQRFIGNNLKKKFHDWEVSPYWDLMEGIYWATLRFGEDDRREWEWENNDKYLVKSFYSALAKERAQRVLQPHEGEDDFPHKIFLDASVPFRVAFFSWRSYVWRRHTINKLNSKGMNLVGECALCRGRRVCGTYLAILLAIQKGLRIFFTHFQETLGGSWNG